MRCDDDILIDFVIEKLCDSVRGVLLPTSESDEITLNDSGMGWKIIKASMENVCHVAVVIFVNVCMALINFDFPFVEY